MVFYWSLGNSKSPQVSRTLLSILAVLNNAVVWMVSTRLPTSKSPSPFNNPLVNVLKAPITIGTIVTFMSYSFFNSLARSRYLFFFSYSFNFILWSAGTAKSTILPVLFSGFWPTLTIPSFGCSRFVIIIICVISRTFFSILTDFSNFHIQVFQSLFVPSAPSIIGITVTFMFPNFF